MDIAVSVGGLGQVQAGVAVQGNAVPLQAELRRRGVELADMIDLAHLPGLVVAGRDAPERPVAGAAVAGMGRHDRPVRRGQTADHDDRAGFQAGIGVAAGGADRRGGGGLFLGTAEDRAADRQDGQGQK